MTDSEFLNRCLQRRSDAAKTSRENRARVELFNAALREARASHACLMHLSVTSAAELARRAIAQDIRDGNASRHTNALDITFYKYFK